MGEFYTSWPQNYSPSARVKLQTHASCSRIFAAFSSFHIYRSAGLENGNGRADDLSGNISCPVKPYYQQVSASLKAISVLAFQFVK